MDNGTFWIRFGLAVLAVWRITHLLSREDGPFDVILRMRRALGRSQVGRMLDCPYCLSMWIAGPGACFMRLPLWETVAAWLALSGAACLIERSARAPVVFQTQPENTEEEIAS